MTEQDPERLAAGKDSLVKSLIEEGRKELASPSQLAAVAARLGPVLGGGGGPGGTGPGGAGSGAAHPASVAAPKAAGLGLAKGLGIAALGAATLVTVLRVVTTPQQAAIPLTLTPEGPQPTEPVVPPDLLSPLASLTPPEPSTAPPMPHHGEVATPAAPVKRDPNAGAELRMLTEAQDALPADPAKALAICNDAARRFPSGAFGQEREALAIQALTGLGKTDEAHKRADAFYVAYPDSPLARRIKEVLASP
jgi:hypothetical protein